MDEPEFRNKLQSTLDHIEKAFDGVDPDIAECEQSLGSMTITLADKSRCILSAQPSVRQLWLALAARGTAYHFDFDPGTGTWVDDKTRKLEFKSFLRQYLKETTGLDLSL